MPAGQVPPRASSVVAVARNGNSFLLPPFTRTSLSGGRLILPERLGNGLSGTGGLLVSESVSLAEDCDRSGTATSVDGTPLYGR
ncbi:hypothetical protein TNCV_1609041 [Trichonephila clavipes]|nr:hypothetical protein TNCV_1609041 [Trichonephila clavipes]